MTDPVESERRIEQLERDLAQVQAKSTYCQMDAILVRRRLKDTLAIAVHAIERMGAGFLEEGLTSIGNDLAGGEKK